MKQKQQKFKVHDPLITQRLQKKLKEQDIEYDFFNILANGTIEQIQEVVNKKRCPASIKIVAQAIMQAVSDNDMQQAAQWMFLLKKEQLLFNEKQRYNNLKYNEQILKIKALQYANVKLQQENIMLQNGQSIVNITSNLLPEAYEKQ